MEYKYFLPHLIIRLSDVCQALSKVLCFLPERRYFTPEIHLLIFFSNLFVPTRVQGSSSLVSRSSVCEARILSLDMYRHSSTSRTSLRQRSGSIAFRQPKSRVHGKNSWGVNQTESLHTCTVLQLSFDHFHFRNKERFCHFGFDLSLNLCHLWPMVPV